MSADAVVADDEHDDADEDQDDAGDAVPLRTNQGYEMHVARAPFERHTVIVDQPASAPIVMMR